MNKQALLELLAAALDADADGSQELAEAIAHVTTFEEAGMLTRDAGLVLRMRDGSEFQLTLVKSR